MTDIDWRELLIRYMENVIGAEGSYFIENGPVELAQEERDALREIAEEVEKRIRRRERHAVKEAMKI